MKILFVCHGNICRRPKAEFVMKDMALEAGCSVSGLNSKEDAEADAEADFEIASAVTSTEEIGNPVYPPARKKLAEMGVGVPGNDLGVQTKRARQMTRLDYEYYDRIICMDRNNIRNAHRITGGDPDAKICLLLDYTKRAGGVVADSWYTGDFDATWRDVEEGCEGILKAYIETIGKSTVKKAYD